MVLMEWVSRVDEVLVAEAVGFEGRFSSPLPPSPNGSPSRGVKGACQARVGPPFGFPGLAL